MSQSAVHNTEQCPELGLIRFLPRAALRPSCQNDVLYRPVDRSDPELRELAASIKQNGILEPLVISCDRVIVSGHRRFAAAGLAGLTEVPCRELDILSTDPGFLSTLREFNRQREKTDAERLREEVVSADPEESYRNLREHRRQSAQVEGAFVRITGTKTRATISGAKLPFLQAIDRVLKDLRNYLPVSDRQIHYALLNNPPLMHASKPDSLYQNQLNCYKSLCELLTRARLAGLIAMDVIADETRPVIVWKVHATTRPFLRAHINDLWKGYWRDLQQSQPNHIEILGEKNTVGSILSPVAAEYCLPITTGRGYCSLPPRYALAERYQKSGREKLILLVLSDFDPDGEEICHSFARSLRDDFGIRQVQAIKVALTQEQVQQFRLPANMEAKKGSANYQKFAAKYGDQVFELEALPPAELQRLLREAIDSVLDIDAFNGEIDAEKQDAAFLDTARRRVLPLLSEAAGEKEETTE